MLPSFNDNKTEFAEALTRDGDVEGIVDEPGNICLTLCYVKGNLDYRF